MPTSCNAVKDRCYSYWLQCNGPCVFFSSFPAYFGGDAHTATSSHSESSAPSFRSHSNPQQLSGFLPRQSLPQYVRHRRSHGGKVETKIGPVGDGAACWTRLRRRRRQHDALFSVNTFGGYCRVAVAPLCLLVRASRHRYDA